MKKLIGQIVNRSKVVELTIPPSCEDQVKDAFNFRMLSYPEDLKDCVMLEGIDKGVRSIKYNFKNSFDSGEAVGYFSGTGEFIKNTHWSERMRSIMGNPTPECCGFKMHANGLGFRNDPSIKWQCAQCEKIVPAK